MKLKFTVKSLEEVDEKYRDLYEKKGEVYEFVGVEGLKTQADIDRLQEALRKERSDHKELKDKWGHFKETPDEIQKILDEVPALRIAAGDKATLEEKANSLAAEKIKSATAPLERENEKLKKELSEAVQARDGYKNNIDQYHISDAVRAAATKLKVQESAIEDALVYGERLFTINDNGDVVTKDGVGVTPGISAESWLTDMQSKRPHWWGGSMGGGAGGSKAGGIQHNPWTAEHWNMTEQGRIYNENAARAQELARMAGTTIGGPMPPNKK